MLRALPLVVRFWPLSSPNPPKRTSRLVRLAVLLALPLVVRFGRSAQILQHAPCHLGLLGCLLWWSVLAAQQPKSSKTDLASLVCLAGLLALLWWSVLAAQQPKTDLGSLVCLAVLLALPLVVRFVRLKREAA